MFGCSLAVSLESWVCLFQFLKMCRPRQFHCVLHLFAPCVILCFIPCFIPCPDGPSKLSGEVFIVCVFCECAVVVSFIPCFIPCFIPPVSYPCAHPCFRVPVSRKRGQKTHPYEHCRSVNTTDLKKVGTSVCECALFVNWVVLGNLSADPGILVAVFSLDTQGRRSRRPHRYRARFRFCF